MAGGDNDLIPTLENLSHEQALEQVRELTLELREFERSSRELEDAMELELEELGKDKERLIKQNSDKDAIIADQKKKIILLEQEMMIMMEKNNQTVTHLETQLALKSKNLIDVEILNDKLENGERILKNEVQGLEDRYNELLERHVLLQGELSDQTHKLNHERLLNTNNKSQITELENKVAQIHSENNRLKIRLAKPEKIARYKTPLVSSTEMSNDTVVQPTDKENLEPELLKSKTNGKSLFLLFKRH